MDQARGTQSVIKARLQAFPVLQGPRGCPQGAAPAAASLQTLGRLLGKSCLGQSPCWEPVAGNLYISQWISHGSYCRLGAPGLHWSKTRIVQPNQAVHFWLGCQGRGGHSDHLCNVGKWEAGGLEAG